MRLLWNAESTGLLSDEPESRVQSLYISLGIMGVTTITYNPLGLAKLSNRS